MSRTDSQTHHIHLGARPDQVAAIQAAARDAGAVLEPYEGDGWNTWGERVGTDANDDVTLHVVLRHEGSEPEAIATVEVLLRRAEAGDFALTTSTDSLATLAVITPVSDHSVDEAGGHVWARTDDGHVHRAVPAPGSIAAVDIVIDARIALGAVSDPYLITRTAPSADGVALVHTGQERFLSMIHHTHAYARPGNEYEWVDAPLEGDDVTSTTSGDLEAARTAVRSWLARNREAQTKADAATLRTRPTTSPMPHLTPPTAPHAVSPSL